jgi:pSer/pThr/pTyr-binding forkhead associated (FHA) protein/tetratricopeptide (TPR) repeat protein
VDVGGREGLSASEAGLFKLIIEDDEGHTTIVPLVKEEITIGRKEGNTIRLTERNVSRHHARLIKSNGTVFIEDLDSYNGVKVNGDKITARTNVREGDLIEIGDYHFALQWIEEQGPPPTPSGAPPIPKTESPPALPQAQARAPALPPKPIDGPTAVLKLPLEEKPEEEGRARTIPEKEAGRLVIITTELAGSEFPLTRTEMLIGRTEENDVVLAHRSVSSRHAKIVYDGGIYRIIDMDSANGVLVNGEEYSRVDLRRGDTIELGHVRIRYVAPGEVYQYAPEQAAEMVAGVSQPEVMDASVMEDRLERPATGKKVGLITGGVALVALIAFGVYHFTRPGETPGEESPAKATEPAATEPETTPATEPGEEDPAAARFKEGTAKLGRRDFEGAIVAFNAVLSENPQYPGVQTMLDKARAEKESSESLSKAQAAIAEKDYDAAWGFLAQIPADSIFAKEAEAIKPDVRTKYISFHLNKAKRYMDNGLLEEALKHVESVLIVDENNIYARNQRKQINRMMKSKRPPAVAAVEERPPQPRKKPPPPRRSRKKELQELLDRGKKAVRTKRFADAVSSFKAALKLDPRNCGALVSIGIVYARWGKREKSYIYYKKFLDACPKHMQAPQVRQIVQQFEDWKRQNR